MSQASFNIYCMTASVCHGAYDVKNGEHFDNVINYCYLVRGGIEGAIKFLQSEA